MTRICTICARGGSKGVKNKNIRPINGKPLIVYSIEQARASGLFDVIAVSSDSEKILSVAGSYGVDYLVRRPDDLATDAAAKLPAIRHCVSEVEKLSNNNFNTCVDLDATSPLRLVKDIHNAVNILETSGFGNLITVTPSRRSPYFNLIELNKDGIPRLSKSQATTVIRRQDAPQCYDMNASIYVWTRQALFSASGLFNQNTQIYVMPEERSVDVDSELDFLFVEFIMKCADSGKLPGEIAV